jgi:hypothetical protein
MNAIIKIVPDIGESYPQREINSARLFAVRLKTKKPQFALIKTARYPKGFNHEGLTLSHFVKPIGMPTLNRYIAANLS